MTIEKYKNENIKQFSNSGPRNAFFLRDAYDRAYSNNISSYNFHQGKDMLYGRIDGNNNVVHVNESFLKQIDTKKSKSVLCLNFVADAFLDFRNFVKRGSAKRILPDQFLTTNWDAQRGWSSPHIFYDRKMDDIYRALISGNLVLKKNEDKIRNVEDFIEIFFNDFYPSLDNRIPLTKTGVIMSKYYNPTSTGLCIELTNNGYSLEYDKINKYLKSPNYDFYTRAAAKYGFIIDKNAPWRMVANINSPAMQKYMEAYDINVDNIFDVCYIKTYLYDIDNLKVYVKQMYAAFTSLSPFYIKENETYSNQKCPSYKQAKYVTVQREKISNENYDDKYSDLFWLKIYYKIKLSELGVKISNSAIEREMIKLEQLYNSLDYDQSLEYINNKVKSQIPWV